MSEKIIYSKIEKYASYYSSSYYLERKMLNALKAYTQRGY